MFWLFIFTTIVPTAVYFIEQYYIGHTCFYV